MRAPLREMSVWQRAIFLAWARDHHDGDDLDNLSAGAYQASSRLNPE